MDNYATHKTPKIKAWLARRPHPVLPMMPGVPERRTHSYVRHGTTTLFAAQPRRLCRPRSQYAVVWYLLGCIGWPLACRVTAHPTAEWISQQLTGLWLESSAAIARAIGASHFQIMARELLPNLVPPISAIVVLSMSRIIVIEGTLSFLGLSLPPPAPTWGNMTAAGVSELASTRPSGLSAGVMFITILALVVISDALRRASDLRGDQSRHFAGLPMTFAVGTRVTSRPPGRRRRSPAPGRVGSRRGPGFV
jgi:Binding-protein-dependent transport system inner membrane component